MFEKIEMMRMARALGAHASQRHLVVTRNIANADTPGFKAADTASFADSYRRADLTPMRTTDPRHLAARCAAGSDRRISAAAPRLHHLRGVPLGRIRVRRRHRRRAGRRHAHA